MVFADEATVVVKAGKGGDGSVHFRREKFVPRGGPDGGDGGRGGSVYFVATHSLNTLLPFVYKSRYAATPGQPGGERKKHGAAGKDLVLRVPPGTLVRDSETGEDIADVVEPGARVLICRGGRGGLGNTHFATATNQVPRVADRGEPGEERTLSLELKLIAEVGIIGMPNAGKSTLLSVVSAARPKIASYPFTTLQPQLGVAEVDERAVVFADIPGLIEGAHTGIGLGHAFLRHVDRTRLLVHVVDGSGQEGRDPYDDLRVVNDELRAHSPSLASRPQIVAVNKMDLPEARERFAELRRRLGRAHPVVPIAAATREGIDELLRAVVRTLDSLPEEPVEPALVRVKRPEAVRVERDDGHWVASGSLVSRLVAMTDLGSPEGMDRLRRRLAQVGVEGALVKQGGGDGDTLITGVVRWRLQHERLTFDGYTDVDAYEPDR